MRLVVLFEIRKDVRGRAPASCPFGLGFGRVRGCILRRGRRGCSLRAADSPAPAPAATPTAAAVPRDHGPADAGGKDRTRDDGEALESRLEIVPEGRAVPRVVEIAARVVNGAAEVPVDQILPDVLSNKCPMLEKKPPRSSLDSQLLS